MNKNKDAYQVTAKQKKVLSEIIVDSIPNDFSYEVVQKLIYEKKELEKRIAGFFLIAKNSNRLNLIKEWEIFYYKLIGKRCDFSNIVIPQKP